MNNATIYIVDAIGRKMNPIIVKEKNEIKVFRNALPSGIYFVRIEVKNEIIGVVKLIAE
jgi:hypothetical protein